MQNLVDYIQERINNIHLSDFISKIYIPTRKVVLEMGQLSSNLRLGNKLYDISLHGPNSGDRPHPHIHIYKPKLNKSFDFEISLVDLLCNDELNLISMKDKDNNINRRNRNICSWEGYRKMKNDFEEWLESTEVDIIGDFKNNIEAAIYTYNREAGMNARDINKFNPFLEYIISQGKKIHDNYKELFSDEIKEIYPEAF